MRVIWYAQLLNNNSNLRRVSTASCKHDKMHTCVIYVHIHLCSHNVRFSLAYGGKILLNNAWLRLVSTPASFLAHACC